MKIESVPLNKPLSLLRRQLSSLCRLRGISLRPEGVFPSRGASGEEVKLCELPRPLLQGEVASRRDDGEVGQHEAFRQEKTPHSKATRRKNHALRFAERIPLFGSPTRGAGRAKARPERLISDKRVHFEPELLKDFLF